jgi:hypothetical protein
LQISLNGHEWVQRQAQKQAISWVKEGNCFVGGSDLAGLNRLAQGLDGVRGLARLAQVVDRWVYSACLCFALTREQQQRSGFRYAYSCYQLEYSRNLLFKMGASSMKSIKGSLTGRAGFWMCLDSKPSSVANGVPLKATKAAGDWRRSSISRCTI